MLRYNGDVGDVVVGRIAEVGQKKWRVELNSKQYAGLLLSAINLPGGLLVTVLIVTFRRENERVQMN
jgi:exosome complex component RRP4